MPFPRTRRKHASRGPERRGKDLHEPALYSHARARQIADGPDEVRKRSIARRDLRR